MEGPNLHICADPECGEVFEPMLPQRIYCYNPECKARRIARNNKAKKDRVKERKMAGEIRGIGKGRYMKVRESDDEGRSKRTCLKCDKEFRVPLLTDNHICDKCHKENSALLDEFTDEALGLYPPNYRDQLWDSEV